MYKCKHFKIYELVDPVTYKRFGDEAWMFLNPLILMAADGIREYFGVPVTINNWHWGGEFQWSGLRTVFCTIGGKWSQHRFANAIDCDIKDIPAEEARQRILANQNHPLLQHITCIEASTNWLHIDSRNIKDRIRIVYP
ncbi:MAG: hypothetical protein Q7J85_07070 [Bacillota bacterium]|nr:hypothetical protein [Bacillota bacterium]